MDASKLDDSYAWYEWAIEHGYNVTGVIKTTTVAIDDDKSEEPVDVKYYINSTPRYPDFFLW